MSGRNSSSHNRRDKEDDGRWNNLPDKEFVKSAPLLLAIDGTNKDARQLKTTKFDYHAEQNRMDHHTDEYENTSLILRRGQVFNMSVTFDRPMDAEQDKITLQFVTGSRPQQSKNSIIRVPVTESLPTTSWGVQIVKQREATVDLSVMSPAHAIVGVYSVYVETKVKTSDGKYLTFRKKLEQQITFLFNAWCEGDTVYMDNDDHRNEYVLNDRGSIWIGTYKYINRIPWYFGQFEPVSLETCLELIKMSEIKEAARGNPILICRAISKLVNSNDDGGVLIGNWSGDYKDGTDPSAWIGSVAILNKYAVSKQKESVKYGQCWVFSGLVTTLLRAIGIPTRSVTNFSSAHDSDGSFTIDYYFDKDGNPMTWLDDSMWNFHVWNESYFTRPDLPSGYDGWQANDATPQETSDGVFQCGPCPVKAIQKGEVYLPYDAGFVFAEVNGDKVFWNADEEGAMTVINVDKKSVGKSISTKAVGSYQREDLTRCYKFEEGSLDERNAVKLANQTSSLKDVDIYSTSSSNDVSFAIQTSDNVMIGANFDIKLILKNASNEARIVRVTIVVKSSSYTGVVASDLKDKTEEITVAAGKDETVVLPITFDDYRKMALNANIRVFFNAKVKETGQVFCNMDTVEMIKPELEADLPDQVTVNNRFQVTFRFTNPLPVKLKHGKVNVEGRGLFPNTFSYAIRKDIGPHEKASIPVTMEYNKKGARGHQFFNAAFHSDQLAGVRGEFEISVVE